MSLSPVLCGQKSAVSSCPSSSPRRVLPGALLWDCDSLPLPLLLDASRDHCFIDENLAKQAQLPVEVLPESRIIQDLDSRHIARITHQTRPLTLVFSGNHREVIQLFLIPSSAALAVLGSPWVVRHNPQLDRSTGSLTGWSVACHSHCLRSALSSSPQSSTQAPDPPDLSTVPEEYHDLGGVFCKQHAFTLPRILTAVESVYFSESVPFPTSRLYNLS